MAFPEQTTGVGVPARVVVQAAQLVTDIPRALLRPAQTAQLNPLLVDETGNIISRDGFSFSSADGSIATVSDDGLISAVANGTTTVTITNGGLALAASVTVSDSSVYTGTTPWGVGDFFFVSVNPGGQS